MEQMAREKPGWGYQPIQGELRGLGIRVSAAAVRRVLKRLRIPPAPRRTRSTWRRFLRTQAAALLAGDFFPVDCAVTWRRGCVFFVIEVSTRHGHVLGVTAHPDGGRAVRQARNLLTDPGQRGGRFRFLVRDRAGQLTGAFGAALPGAGIAVVTIPPRSPRANACAGRRVRTARSGLTGRMLSTGPRQLRAVQGGVRRARQPASPAPSRNLRPPDCDQITPIAPTGLATAKGPGRTDPPVRTSSMTATAPAMTLQVTDRDNVMEPTGPLPQPNERSMLSPYA